MDSKNSTFAVELKNTLVQAAGDCEGNAPNGDTIFKNIYYL